MSSVVLIRTFPIRMCVCDGVQARWSISCAASRSTRRPRPTNCCGSWPQRAPRRPPPAKCFPYVNPAQFSLGDCEEARTRFSDVCVSLVAVVVASTQSTSVEFADRCSALAQRIIAEFDPETRARYLPLEESLLRGWASAAIAALCRSQALLRVLTACVCILFGACGACTDTPRR